MKIKLFSVLLVLAIILFSCEGDSSETTSDQVSEPAIEADTSSKGQNREHPVVNKNKEHSVDDKAPKPSPASKATMSPIYGIDISKYQGNEIDFMNRQKDSLFFVICKATEGVTYIDPKFHNNWKEIAQKGFVRGAYHFYRTADNPQAQAEFFVKIVHHLKATDLPLIVDFEGGGIDASQSVEDIQEGLIVFLAKVEQLTRRKPIIYTDITSGNKYLDNPEFAHYPLWIANYTRDDQPDLPKAWEQSGWVFWQRSSNYRIGKTINDFDLYEGTISDLKNFIKNH